MRKILITLTVVIFVTIGAVIYLQVGTKAGTAIAHPQNQTWGKFTAGSTTLDVEIATTPAARERGLSGRTTPLLDTRGILFIFDHPDTYTFWMPDMHFAIDIIWIGADGTIVDIKKNATPESYPSAFKPSAPAVYVLEVGTGNAEKWGWKQGTATQFTITK
jgi:uncharacterized membrane protein (UPF0127 family)